MADAPQHQAPRPPAPPAKRTVGRPGRHQLRHLSPAVMIEELAPPGLMSQAGIIISVLVAAAIGWAAVTPVTQSANTVGQVVPAGSVHRIQHLEGGIVEAIRVRDGDVVQEGEVLVRLNGAASKADLEQLRTRQAVLALRSERLRAFLTGDDPDFGAPGRRHWELALHQADILAADRQSARDSLSVLQKRLEQRRSELDARTEKAVNLAAQLEVAEGQLAIRETLYAKELGSLVQVLTARAETTRLQGLLAEERAAVVRADKAVAEAGEQIAEREAAIREDAVVERAEVAAELAEVTEAVARLEDRVARLDVRAPVHGVVDALAVHTIGAVVGSGDTLLQIVPIGDRMFVEARIEPRDVGFVAVGQEARVALDGFDVRQFGRLTGNVHHVSATTIADADDRQFYRVRLALAADRIETDEAVHRILPGMTVQAQINLGTQTVLEFLLRPVYASLSTALNER